MFQISCAHRSLTPAVSLTRPLFSVAVSFHAEVTKIACPFPSSPCGTWPRKVKFNSFRPLLAFPHSSSQFMWGPEQFLDCPLFVGLPAWISFSGCLICLSSLHEVYSAQVPCILCLLGVLSRWCHSGKFLPQVTEIALGVQIGSEVHPVSQPLSFWAHFPKVKLPELEKLTTKFCLVLRLPLFQLSSWHGT